ncbi:MAG: hypothetical protein E6F96_05975 [Actinobacteria bacterium]|nr:MAG: hypothetical protein E6F96_05975 [Actinomycetota bacterium]
MEVTAASELDALAHSPALASEHGAGLLALFAGARDRLSETAWRACVDLLGTHVGRREAAASEGSQPETPR